MDDLIGKKLGAYEIIAPLGEGGMASVYQAYQASMERNVALKVLPHSLAKDPQFVARFQNEARIIAKLIHPYILPIHDYGEAEGYPYLVMPFIRSGTLGTLMQAGPFPLARARQFITQIADALDHAHSQGIIHRDLKPANILVDERGNCLLTDFGIAKLVQEGTEKITATGALIGTPAYMSPEQGRGEAVDERTDIYTLGVILYEMVTGRAPFKAETPVAVMLKHIQEAIPSPRMVNPEVPQAVEQVIIKALAKDPAERFATAGELAHALRAALPEDTWPRAAGEELTMLGQPQPIGSVKASRSARGVATSQVLFKRGSFWGWAVLALILVAIIGSVVWRNTPDAQQATAPASSTVTRSTASPLAPQLEAGAQTTGADGAVLLFIPAGPFVMGSANNDLAAQANEKPQTTIFLNAYWIDQTEVTNAHYAQCVQDGLCIEPASANYPLPKFADHPVTNVDWSQAKLYCTWAKRRLPTEAEWEKAARGLDGAIWPWGNKSPDETFANFAINGTQPVGSFAKGASRAYGALDMAGNVWEWVNDWYVGDYYKTMPTDNPPGPRDGVSNLRVVRGGSWGTNVSSIRAANRNGNAPTEQRSTIGFRCAVDAEP